MPRACSNSRNAAAGSFVKTLVSMSVNPCVFNRSSVPGVSPSKASWRLYICSPGPAAWAALATASENMRAMVFIAIISMVFD